MSGNKENEKLANKKINPTGAMPVLVFKGSTPAGYLNRCQLRNYDQTLCRDVYNDKDCASAAIMTVFDLSTYWSVGEEHFA